MTIQSDDWPSAVAAHLAGKDHVTMTAVAREALGRGYRDMDAASWRRLCAILHAAGWRAHRSGGATTWRPEPAEPPAQPPQLILEGITQ